MRRNLVPWLALWTHVLLAAALGWCAVGIALGAGLPAWSGLACIALNWLTIIWQRRMWTLGLRRGRLQEQLYVMGSISEAEQRGMTPLDWMAAYCERATAELAEPPRRH